MSKNSILTHKEHLCLPTNEAYVISLKFCASFKFLDFNKKKLQNILRAALV